MSSVDCSKNITGKFFKECNLCFSLMWRLIWVQNKLIIIIVVWKQCTCQILLMDKALQNCLHVLQCNHRFRSLLSFWATTPLQSFPLSLLFVRHTHAQNSNASTAKPMAFALSHTLAPTSGTISPKTSGTLLLSLPSKANSRHSSSQNISAKQHCPSS